MILVDDRRRRVIAHSARAQQMRRRRLWCDRRLGHLSAPAALLEDLGAAILEEPRVRQIVGMVPVRDAKRRKSPRILDVRIEGDVVRLDRE